jgi:hypothetical protein
MIELCVLISTGLFSTTLCRREIVVALIGLGIDCIESGMWNGRRPLVSCIVTNTSGSLHYSQLNTLLLQLSFSICLCPLYHHCPSRHHHGQDHWLRQEHQVSALLRSKHGSYRSSPPACAHDIGLTLSQQLSVEQHSHAARTAQYTVPEGDVWFERGEGSTNPLVNSGHWLTAV